MIESSIQINARPDAIWRFITNFENWSQFTRTKTFFQVTATAFSAAAGSAPGPGMRIDAVGAGPRQTWVVRDWTPPAKLAMESQTNGWFDKHRFQIEFNIRPRDSLSSELGVGLSLELQNPLAASVASLLGTDAKMEKHLATILERIKTLLEQ